MNCSIIVTYRCNAKCQMCNTWKYPSSPKDEISPRDLQSLPHVAFCNITGGEPFLRDDIDEFIDIMGKKSDRIVISTNGYFTEKIIDVVKKYPKTGIRVSIEGLAAVNDELRGIKDGFDHGMRTITELKKIGAKDIGFGITLSDKNILDLMALYKLGKSLDMEFATACVHNSYYFHKLDNKITRIPEFEKELKKLITDLLKSMRVKNWFRAYFNYGLLNYIRGKKRLLPCGVGRDVFFIDPFGNVMPCNGMEMSMGNIKEKTFGQIWNSPEAENVRKAVGMCRKECWMIGSVEPAMRKEIIKPILWVIKNKIKVFFRREI